MRIPIAKDGYMFIIPLGILTIIFLAVSLPWVGLLFGLLLLFNLYFFRDPERIIPSIPNAIVSPADGKITHIVEDTHPFLQEPCIRISIFLSVLNVHVNRIPVAGEIEKIHYNKGKFLDARNDKASLDNEHNILVIKNDRAKILVKQIAGLIARRIVCRAKPGDHFETGQRFGLIRFGSRVDLYVPRQTDLQVICGDTVFGGKTHMGTLK